MKGLCLRFRQPRDRNRAVAGGVYPNPNEGNFIVGIYNNKNVDRIEIMDQIGRRVDVRTEVVKENIYKTLKFSPGSYWIKIIYTDSIIHKKMIIQ